jgi:hypothetical protein
VSIHVFGNQNKCRELSPRVTLRKRRRGVVAYNSLDPMPRFRPKGVLERSAASDLWKHTLSKIPTLYGRLSYLASLRDSNSGNYRHHGLTALFGREESAKALRASHEQAFAEWLTLSLADKSHDLTSYLASLEEDRVLVAAHWLRSRLYRTQAPNSAHKMERALFCADMEALLETVRDAPGASEPDPGSSRPE